MKKFLVLVLCFFLVSSFRIFSEDVTILFLTDTHNNMSPGGPRTPDLKGSNGGIARVATFVKQVRDEDPSRMTLLLHGGDSFIGDIMFNTTNGLRELNALQMLGVDAMVLGNHEFDLKSVALNSILSVSTQLGWRDFPVLCANINGASEDIAGLDSIVGLVGTFVNGAVNIGVFGLTTPKTNFYSQKNLVMENVDSVATEMVSYLKSLNCNIIICLSHCGKFYDSQIAQNVEGIDLIIGGHDHELLTNPKMFDHSGKVTYYVQSGAFYRTMGRVDITFDSNKVEKLVYDYVNIDENIEEDPDMKHFIDSLEEDANNSFQMNCFSQQVASAEDVLWEKSGSLSDEGFKDTPVGNLVTDAFLATIPGADIAIEPCGSTAQQLYTGPIVANDVFRMIGYGFSGENIAQHYMLVTFDLTGVQLLVGLQIVLKDIALDDELLVQCSGLEYAYYTNHDSTDRLIIDSVKVKGEPVQSSATYKIVTNEYVAALFSGMLKSPLTNLVTHDTSEFKAVLDYVTLLSTLTPVSEGRVKAYIDPNIGVDEFTANKTDFRINPNPAKGIVNISFDITESGFYSMKIFNSMGHEIYEVFNQSLESGYHTKILDASKFPTGLYFIKLTNGRIIKSVKLLVN
ncbi:MAG: T9SS type A sorting domain-containing protein [Bacteroidetes bacterium]|nr:MAG: T9SS type A sorting domain-containing protein [Bacteroidota bacterium]